MKDKGKVKIIHKLILCMVLVTGILTSCHGFISIAATDPTEAIATVTLTDKPALTVTTIATVTVPAVPFSTPFPPTPIPFFTFPIDRHDPESVIRAYFDAWERSDSSAMASVLSSKFGQNFIFEPLEAMEVLNIELISDPASTERIYSVLYEAKWKGQKNTNQTRWRFRLTWDANRDSWIIIGYGSG